MTHKEFVDQINVNGLSPQCRTLYRHLTQRKAAGISQMEATLLYKIMALPRRIADLKEAGIHIKAENKVDQTGTRYARYSLEA